MPHTRLRSVLLLGVVLGLAVGASAHEMGEAMDQPEAPAPPTGATRVLRFDRVDGRTAVCATTGEPDVTYGSRQLPHTGIWVGTAAELRRLDTPLACDPAWSPDGGRLAFTTPEGLWVLADPEVGEPRLLLEAPDPGEETEFGYVAFRRPVWSPNGARLGYLATNGGTTWVEVVEVIDGRLRFRSHEETYAFSWGADSRSLRIGGNTVLVP
jgi:hypothetical protein